MALRKESGKKKASAGVSRRGFIQGVGIGGGAVELLQAKAASPALATAGMAGPGEERSTGPTSSSRICCSALC